MIPALLPFRKERAPDRHRLPASAEGVLEEFSLAETRMELTEHLEELRTRIMRVIIYLAVGTTAAWFAYPWLYKALTGPVMPVFRTHGVKVIFISFTEGFFLQLKVAMMAGVAISLPFITREVWGFVAPGLTRQERKATLLLIPFATLLFAGGTAMAYWLLPIGVKWFLTYNPDPANMQIMQRLSDYMLFLAKMCLAFGLAFQLPLVLMFLGKVGIVTSAGLKSHWRYGVVILATVAAIIVPSNDPFSMIAMAVPMVLLYLGSIWLVKWVE